MFYSFEMQQRFYTFSCFHHLYKMSRALISKINMLYVFSSYELVSWTFCTAFCKTIIQSLTEYSQIYSGYYMSFWGIKQLKQIKKVLLTLLLILHFLLNHLQLFFNIHQQQIYILHFKKYIFLPLPLPPLPRCLTLVLSPTFSLFFFFF